MAHTEAPEKTRHNHQQHDHDTHGHSLVELIKDLREESTHLIRQEVNLAKAEMSEKAAKYGRNAGYLTTGAAVAISGVLFFAFAGMVGIYNGLVAAGLSHAASGWLAPLIAGVVVSLLGYILIQKAISTFKHESPVPEKSVKSMKENKEWIKEKKNS